ncbi:tetratricopeptide repeat protein [Clostridium butyricum]|uniref:Tetratricopeptide repeat domain protein n=1 Tax=Clostridium butyricum E4 str. BoNT E BL5262 TaxID=632245 RepID=C4ILA0_CLOBU|nr:tetratricopeptide repeat protein [Clostridium butyricum]EDT76341.1 putative tetratricopeptide repeat domain containing protein [Clostridium butyricum 5521]EEP52983.1 tetratricopeptide repeat domain protein [Clostridium butyricum E4 str. BoNT E BL5262]NFL30700.1 tetratricopeptide repeat protein [Clostridium butyricum]NFS18029.1 tetratricopeptide repeat protein [Clostridium butyricum]
MKILKKKLNEYLTKERVHKQRGEYYKALEYNELMIKINPSDEKLYILQMDILIKINEPTKMLRCCNKIIELSFGIAGVYYSGMTSVYYNKGIALTELMNDDEAIDTFKKVIKINPEFQHVNFEIGMCYYRMKQYIDAITFFEKELKINNKNYEAILNIGYCYGYINKNKEAMKCFEKVIKLDSNLEEYLDAYISKASILRELNKSEQAIKCLDELLKVNSSSGEAFFYKGLIFNEQNNIKESIKCLDKIIELGSNVIFRENKQAQMNIENMQMDNHGILVPNIINAYLIKATILEEKMLDLDKALECFKQAKKIDDKNTYANIHIAIVLDKLGRVEESLKVFDFVIANDKSIEGIYCKGFVMLKRENYIESIDLFNKVIARDDKNIDAYINKGIALKNVGNIEEAIKCFEKAIYLDDKFAYAYFLKGTTLFENNCCENIKEILECINKAIELNSKYFEAYFNKAIILDSIERYSEAISILKESLSFTDKKEQVYLQLGATYCHMNDNKKSIECFDKAISLDSNYVEAYYNKGIILFSQGELNEALQCFNEIIEKNDKYIEVYLERASVLTILGRFNEAVESCEKVIQIDDNNDDAYYKRTIILSALKKDDEAIESIKKAIQINDKQYTYFITYALLLNLKGKSKEALKQYSYAIKINPKCIMIGQPLFDYFSQNRKESGKVFYHYTDAYALKSILETKKFWVTKSDYLNDSSEIKFIAEMTRRTISLAENDTSIDGNMRIEFIEFMNIINKLTAEIFEMDTIKFESQLYTKEDIERMSNYIKECLPKEIYVLSLTDKDDLLALWGNYAKSDGYNLGINSEKLFNHLDKLQETKQYFDVYYDGNVVYEDSDKEVYHRLKSIFEQWREIEDIKSVVLIALNQIILFSMFIKHPSFIQEHEYRIAFLILDEKNIKRDLTKFRVSNGAIIPYIEIPLEISNSSLNFNSIKVAPKNKSDIAQKGVQYFLKKKNISLDEKDGVKISSIPLRY